MRVSVINRNGTKHFPQLIKMHIFIGKQLIKMTQRSTTIKLPIKTKEKKQQTIKERESTQCKEMNWLNVNSNFMVVERFKRKLNLTFHQQTASHIFTKCHSFFFFIVSVRSFSIFFFLECISCSFLFILIFRPLFVISIDTPFVESILYFGARYLVILKFHNEKTANHFVMPLISW